MRKQLAILGILLSLGAAFGLWVLVSAAHQSALRLTFGGSQSGLPYRAAAFYVTNSGGGSMVLQNVHVQVLGEGGWKQVSEKPIEVVPVIEKGQLYNSWPSLLPSGGYRKFVVEWPKAQPWRVCITYGPEAVGLNGLIEKGKLAWRNRTLSELRTRTWIGTKSLFSEEIAKQD